MNSRGDPRVLLRVDRGEALASGLHVFAGPVRDLPHRGHRFADRGGDFVVIETEHLAQHEHRAFVGTQGLQQHQHRHRNRFGQNDIGRRILLVEQQRLGQPRSDVVLAAPGAGAQRVERLTGDQPGQIGLRVVHAGQVYLRPAQVAVLEHVIGFGCRAQDFVGDGEQQRPQQHEPFGVFVGGGHGDRDRVGARVARAACRP